MAGNLGQSIVLMTPVIYTMGQSLGWWDVDSSDMATAEGNQFDGAFKTLSASDLPTAIEADAMAGLLPVATDPLA